MTRLPRLVIRARAAIELGHSMDTRIEAALHRMIDITPDGYPSGGDGGGRGKNTISDPTGSAAIRRTTGTGPGYATADDEADLGHQLAIIAEAWHRIGDICNRYQRATSSATDRCNGNIDPLCRNVPVEAGGLCVDCLPHACPKCRNRPLATDPPRRLESGQLGCEACCKAERRYAKVTLSHLSHLT